MAIRLSEFSIGRYVAIKTGAKCTCCVCIALPLSYASCVKIAETERESLVVASMSKATEKLRASEHVAVCSSHIWVVTMCGMPVELRCKLVDACDA